VAHAEHAVVLLREEAAADVMQSGWISTTARRPPGCSAKNAERIHASRSSIQLNTP
jgi:hypothetical protein